MVDPYPAHIRENEVQSVSQHCQETATRAREVLAGLGLGQAGYLAGLIHDLGKYTPKFKAYLERAASGQEVRRGEVNHTFAGVRYLLQRFHSPQGCLELKDLTSEIISYAAGAHHGLFNLTDPDNSDKSGFQDRLERPDISYEEAVAAFHKYCLSEEGVAQLFDNAHHDLEASFNKIRELNDETAIWFCQGLLTRLLLAAVIEGDRWSTAQFMKPSLPQVEGTPTAQLWSQALSYMEEKLKTLPQETPIQRARGEISKLCLEGAQLEPGLYRLSVPTGAGKTLASLRYALAHAAKYHKKRLIYVMPLLSIIEQNSAIWRDFLPPEIKILEHHSNVVTPQEMAADANPELDECELLVENWGAPVIITTLVQFLNTLFKGHTSNIRRFQTLAESVIILDEVQSVPPRMLSLFNLALTFLVKLAGATIILASATQPALDKAHRKLTLAVPELVPPDPQLLAPFKRTQIIDGGSKHLAEIPTLITKILMEAPSLLVVCNKRSQAEELYLQLADGPYATYHLSASMCMAHRRQTLDALQKKLEQKEEKVLCISTQVIEAGVDISFNRVLRLRAGMDNIVQAAGRCNRHGEAGQVAPVLVVGCIGEDLKHLSEIKEASSATQELLAQFKERPQSYGNNLTSAAAIDYYYERLYNSHDENYQDYELSRWKTTLLELLTDAPDFRNEISCKFCLQQAFKTAGSQFSVFKEEETRDILVPYAEGEELIADLNSQQAQYDLAWVAQRLEGAQQYTISIFNYQFQELQSTGALQSLGDGSVLALDPNFYHPQLGLTLNPQEKGQPCNILIV